MPDNTKQGTTRIVDLTLLVRVTKLLLFCIVQKHVKALIVSFHKRGMLVGLLQLVSSVAHGSESL